MAFLSDIPDATPCATSAAHVFRIRFRSLDIDRRLSSSSTAAEMTAVNRAVSASLVLRALLLPRLMLRTTGNQPARCGRGGHGAE
jgi:hypothetical protein